MNEPTRLTTRIFEAGRDLLMRECDGSSFRLIGIGISDLSAAEDADQGDLVDTGIVKERAKEDAIDSLRERFGTSAIVRGIAFTKAKKDL